MSTACRVASIMLACAPLMFVIGARLRHASHSAIEYCTHFGVRFTLGLLPKEEPCLHQHLFLSWLAPQNEHHTMALLGDGRYDGICKQKLNSRDRDPFQTAITCSDSP